MHLDTPRAATTRSRLRLGRAALRVDQKRIGFPIPSTDCRLCTSGQPESVHHVLEQCDNPTAVRLRARATRRLVKLCDKLDLAADSNCRKRLSKLTSRLVLKPFIDHADPSDRLLKRVHGVTGRYIVRLQRVWDF